jgi:hypothetical protein
MFRHDEYTPCSAYALGDPVEVKTFYDDLIRTGHDLSVSMPVMESYSKVITRFAIQAYPYLLVSLRAQLCRRSEPLL